MTAQVSPLKTWHRSCVDTVSWDLFKILTENKPAGPNCSLAELQEDVTQQVNCLELALSCNDAAPYHHHLLWYRDLLERRGMPAPWSLRMAEALIAFWRNHSDCPHVDALVHLIEGSHEILRSNTTSARYGQSRLAPLEQADGFFESILEGSHSQAVQVVVQAMDAGVSLVQAGVQIVQPALYAVGDMWQHNRISVAQEHLACAISQNALVAAYMKATFLPNNGKQALFACVQGNHHAVGLRMVCDAVETLGWSTKFLGADVPTFDLVRMADAQRPDLLCLSVSMPQHLAVARQTIDLLHAELGNACPAIWVGGLATFSAPDAWRISGADGYAQDAAQVAQELG